MTAHSENGNAIRERINALDRDEKRNRDNIAELFRSLEEKGKTNWQVIISGFSVLIILTSGILGFTVAPLYTALDELKRQNRSDDKKYLHKSVSDEYRTRIEERLRRHDDDIRAIVARMVDKAELLHTARYRRGAEDSRQSVSAGPRAAGPSAPPRPRARSDQAGRPAGKGEGTVTMGRDYADRFTDAIGRQ